MIFADDNFGVYEMESDADLEETLEFYEYCARNSVEKECQGCGRTVKILPQYAYCNSCAEKIEQGFDL